MHTTPDSFRLNQSPPAASTPAPGPHTSRAVGLLSQTDITVIGFTGSLRGLYSHSRGGFGA